MAPAPAQILEELFSALDRKDASGIQALLGPDAVLLTGWLDQTYSLNGTEQTISAPLSACLELQGGAWRVVSLHAIPLGEAEPS